MEVTPEQLFALYGQSQAQNALLHAHNKRLEAELAAFKAKDAKPEKPPPPKP
jgi:hypothetical protein